jgi:hypothetical protein
MIIKSNGKSKSNESLLNSMKKEVIESEDI